VQVSCYIVTVDTNKKPYVYLACGRVYLLTLTSACVFCLAACSVTFDNTPVPVENIIGEVGEGFKVSS